MKSENRIQWIAMGIIAFVLIAFTYSAFFDKPNGPCAPEFRSTGVYCSIHGDAFNTWDVVGLVLIYSTFILVSGVWKFVFGELSLEKGGVRPWMFAAVPLLWIFGFLMLSW